MAIDERTFDPNLRAGGVITGANIDTATIKGANLTIGKTYSEIAINVTGTTAANVFGTATAPVTGTITSFGLGSLGTAGTVVLFATTAGTIATLLGSGTTGVYVGNATAVNSQILAGDTVTVTPTAGSQTCYITFVSVS